MNIPTASTVRRRDANRIWPLLWAIAAFVVAACVTIYIDPPEWLVGTGFARDGGLRVTWTPRDGNIDLRAIEVRFLNRETAGATYVPLGDHVVVELPGVDERDVPKLTRMIRGEGEVGVHEIREGEDMRALEATPGVTVGTLQCRASQVMYAEASSRAALVAAVRDATQSGRYSLPDSLVAYEATTAGRWRAYPIATENALREPVHVEPTTVLNGTPTIMAAAMLDARLEGGCVVVTVDHEVRTTAIIDSLPPIGLVTLRLDPPTAEATKAVADTIRGGAFPSDGRFDVRFVAATDYTARIWGARAAFAVACGLLAWLFARAARNVVHEVRAGAVTPRRPRPSRDFDRLA